ncbi:hypothetical protein EV175_003385 [Coemansia sp. RSA 1933]|nr:hypothetical protein EV175_003385 [Coemansia sp. RSA 1933]
MKVTKCATIGLRCLVGVGCVFVSAETEQPSAEQIDPSVFGATTQPAGKSIEGSIQPESYSPDVHQEPCFECVVQHIVPIDELNIDKDQKDILVSQLAEEYARLVDEAADSLQRSRIEISNGVESVIRARGRGLGGGRLQPRPRLRPYELLNSLYNEQGKRLVDRMFDLLKKFVSTYANVAATEGDPVSSSTPSTTNPKSSSSQLSVTDEPQKAVEHSMPSSTVPAAATSTSRSHSGKIQTSTKTKSNHDSDNNDDDSEDDDDDDNDDDSGEADDNEKAPKGQRGGNKINMNKVKSSNI